MAKIDQILQSLKVIETSVLINQKSILTIEEASIYMGVSKDYLYKLTEGYNPVIPYSKPKGKIKFVLKSDLDAFMMSNFYSK